MKEEEFNKRLNLFKERAAEQEKLNTQMNRYKQLCPEIRNDVYMAQQLVRAGIQFPIVDKGAFEGRYIKFVADKYVNPFGFLVQNTGCGNIRDWKIYGIVLTGQDGWDTISSVGYAMYNKLFLKDNRDLGEGKDRKYNREVDWHTTEMFCDEFIKFHKEFHEWLEEVLLE